MGRQESLLMNIVPFCPAEFTGGWWSLYFRPVKAQHLFLEVIYAAG